MFKGINAIEFAQRFASNEDCYEYLLNRKWPNGFECSRCGYRKSNKGRTSYHRRCKHCGYDESVTANTIFHGVKMPILKVFHMIFRVSAKKKGMSTIELGNEVSVQQKTAWLFKRKVQVAMKQSNNDKLRGNVDVDETMFGFHTNRKLGGRNLTKREALMIAAEILPDGRTGNIRMQQIDNFKAVTFKYALKDMVSPDAYIRADNYCSYRTIQRDMSNLQIESSNNGKAYEQIHRQIMLFKNWLVGIHHKWSKEHFYAYVDEYVFRFDRRNRRGDIFNSVIGKMMHQVPHPYPVIRTLCGYST